MTTPAPTSTGRRSAVVGLAATLLFVAACGGSSDDGAAEFRPVPAADGVEPGAAGIRVVSTADGAALLDDPPAGLVVLDVRTAEEFAEGHLAGATMLDFYADDFADRLADLDPDAPYLVYCRSGNRSGQTRALMEELGFTDVTDVDGGIVAWSEAGLPIER